MALAYQHQTMLSLVKERYGNKFVGAVREAVRPRVGERRTLVAHQDTAPTLLTVKVHRGRMLAIIFIIF